MTTQKLIKFIKNLDFSSSEIIQLKEMASVLENKISSKNKDRYIGNLEVSRRKRTLNNSKQAIKKHWRIRNEGKNKALILKHLVKIREISKLK